MKNFYKKVIQPSLLKMDAEHAYDYSNAFYGTVGKIKLLSRILQSLNKNALSKPVSLFGLSFPNLVGLAAGFDKNAKSWEGLSSLGFGFLEIGTVTAERQPGNPRPRLSWEPHFEAFISHMGMNNDGARAIAQRLAQAPLKHQRSMPLGISIGKTHIVPIENAIEDFIESFRMLADFADYFALNLSSPNLPKLRTLQNRRYLADLLKTLQFENKKRAQKLGTKTIPLLLKISPDLSFYQIDEILEIGAENGLSGIIATNTTTSPPPKMPYKEGGISGHPLFKKAYNAVRYIHQASEGKMPVIACGGILDSATAGAMLDAGASLLQINTGLMYHGPSFPSIVNKAITEQIHPWV